MKSAFLNARFYWVALALLLPMRGISEVIFISSLEPTNVVKVLPLSQFLRLEVAVVRFVPSGKAGEFKGKLYPTNSFLEVVKALGKQGQANLLYLGARDLGWNKTDAATFDSVERRPAFSLEAAVNQTLTNREFGMTLRVKGAPATNRCVELSWQGSFSWSSELIDLWAGDKYLMFGMRLAKFLKPGMVYTQYDDEDDEPAGVNLRTLFKKKPKPDKAGAESAPAGVSFLKADLQKLALDGKQVLKENELAILSFPGRKLDNFQESIYLLLRPSFEN